MKGVFCLVITQNTRPYFQFLSKIGVGGKDLSGRKAKHKKNCRIKIEKRCISNLYCTSYVHSNNVHLFVNELKLLLNSDKMQIKGFKINCL